MAYGTLKADVLQSDTAGTPPQFNDGNGTQTGTLCRAWVNFNGTSGASPVVRASFNISSVTRNGTGNYTINLTNAMPDTNYAVTSYARCNENTASLTNVWGLTSGLDGTKTTTAFQVNFRYYAGTIDTSEVGAAFFR